MKFSDIVTLAKAGYKPKDVKELMALDTEKTEPEPDDKKDKKDPDPDPEATDPEHKDPEPDTKKDPEDPEPDYKKLYEDSKKTLEKLQAKNRKDPDKRTEPKTDEEIAIDFVSELFKGV